ncbi:glycosyltransferase family 4 protein [Oceanimonas marisflavi]|uniref:glycosyltransferase family 4 protein n=1 Tax=Oceanimonas marisflavi TaxID=2059724 RepID=UPI000D323092|nr:glycosyltransferase family 4 protein [Oceanimonas marisflavi]
MRVLHVAEALRGGVDTYLRGLLKYQQSQGVEVHLLVKEDVDWLPKEYVHHYDKGGRGFKSLFRLAKEYIRLVKRLEIDIIHLHGTFAGFVCRMLKGISKDIPLIYCAHGWSYSKDGAFPSIYKSVEKCLSFFCDSVICISHHDYQQSVAVKEKNVLVENAVEDTFYGNEPFATKKQLLFVGRFDRQKGLDILLSAYKKSCVNYALVVVGEGVHNDTYIERNISGVEFKGWLKEAALKEEYLNSAAVIIPSRWEGFGLVALEAMSASRMVISSGVGGLKHLTEMSEGIIYSSEEELVSILKEFEKVPMKKLELKGRIARSFYESNYSIEKMSNKIMQLYEVVVSKRNELQAQVE